MYQGRKFASADLAMQGAVGPWSPSRLSENIFFTGTRALFQLFYGFAVALFEEFVGTDPLGRARFARKILAGIEAF